MQEEYYLPELENLNTQPVLSMSLTIHVTLPRPETDEEDALLQGVQIELANFVGCIRSRFGVQAVVKEAPIPIAPIASPPVVDPVPSPVGTDSTHFLRNPGLG